MVTTNRKNWVRRWFSNQLQGLTTKRRKPSRLTVAEALEDRTLLTAYVVNTLVDDASDGVGDTDGLVSLREAIEAANSDAIFGDAAAGTGADTITFDPTVFGTAQTITLDGAHFGVSEELEITGPDAGLTLDGNDASRIFNHNSPLTLRNLNLTGGNANTGTAGTAFGSSGFGGAINGVSGTPTLTLINSAVFGNTAVFEGGGVWNDGGVTIINSTVSGNSSAWSGGGVQLEGVTNVITNSTITGNVADSDNNQSLEGGGIGASSSTNVTLNNTIVAGNFVDGMVTANDLGSTVTATGNNNLIGDAGTSGGLTDGTDGNIVGNSGTGTIDINTVLNTTLQNRDGAMLHPISFSSPAFNNGSNALSVDEYSVRLQTDQRGGPFVRVMNGTVDIGAHEIVALHVNTLQDETTNPDTLSLREALAIAEFRPGLGNIFSFADAGPGTIMLTQGELEITDDLRIDGPGADQLTIDAQGNSRIFNITGGDVEISGMTLTGGNDIGFDGGGAIRSQADNLVLSSLWIHGNTADVGGGIDIDAAGTTIISGSTISNNTATGNSGGIDTEGDVIITNSTVSGNTSAGSGGGIRQNSGTVTIVNSTITNNRSEDDGGTNFEGGGIYVSNTVTLHNSLVAGNVTGTGTTPSDIDNGSVHSSSSNNLIGDADSAGGLTDGTDGNIVGVAGVGVRDINTILDTTLQDNGGPTPTHGLIAGSEALNNGADNRATEDGEIGSTALTGDQRGENRFDGTVDIGSVEGTGDDHGNTANSATPLTNSVVETGDIESNGDQDWFSFDVVDGRTYNFATFDNVVDTELRLYAADGTTELELDDDGGPGNASLINWTATFTGTAYVSVRHYNDTGTGAYNIVAYDDHGPNSDFATPLALFTPTAGDIEVTGDQDWFVLPVISGLEYTFTATQSDLDGALYLYESDGTTLITDGDAIGQSAPDIITWTATFTGDAYLKMERYNNAGTGTYELTADVVDDHANSSTGATVLTPSTPVAGVIEFNGDQDWFVLPVNSGLEYTFTATQSDLDGALYLYESDGTTLITNGDGIGQSAPDIITWTATFTGDAYLKMERYNNAGTGTYELTAEVTSPPVDNVAGWNATTGRWYFGENVDGTIDQQTGSLWGPGAGWDIHQGDFNGDGVEDIAGRTDTGQWHVIDGATKTSSYWGAWGTDANHRWNDEAVQGIVDVGDFNGDGLDDILGKNWRGEFYVSFSQGGSFSGATYMGRVAQLGWVAHRLGDFDGDGDTDVYSFRENGQRWINESDGSTFTLDFHGTITNQATAQWDHFLVGDFNGDGADDIIQQAIGANGQWWKAESNGLEDGHFNTAFVNRWDASAFIDFQIGDFDGDGRDDLIGQTNTNQFWINRSLPNGRMNLEFFNAWSAAATFDAVVGDFNGDGMDDVAGVRQADGAWFVHQSTGAGSRAIGSVFGSWSNFTGNNEIFTAFNDDQEDFFV